MVVQFQGETGAGEGVTNEFYSAVAGELQRAGVNQDVPMWADPQAGRREIDEDEHLMAVGGLFPQPLLPASDANDAVVERFRFLGRIMAQVRFCFVTPTAALLAECLIIARKTHRFSVCCVCQAILDEKNVPLPLAPEFFALLKDRNAYVEPAQIFALIEGRGQTVQVLHELWAKAKFVLLLICREAGA